MSDNNDNRIGYVVMPLLCTLVGAVAFVSFAMAAVNTAAMAEVKTSEVPPLNERVDQANLINDCLQDSLRSLIKANRTMSNRIDEKIKGRQKLTGSTSTDLQEIAYDIDRINGIISREKDRNDDLRQQLREPKEPVLDVSRMIAGAGGNGDPTFVECVDGAVILQPRNVRISLNKIEKNNYTLASHLKAEGYVVFLVHSEGYEAFEKARSVAKRFGLLVGFEPVNNDWVIAY